MDGQTNADHGHKEYKSTLLPCRVFSKVRKSWVYEAGSEGDWMGLAHLVLACVPLGAVHTLGPNRPPQAPARGRINPKP